MKQGKMVRRLTALLTGVLLISGCYSTISFAGKSEMVIDQSSFAENLDMAVWSNPYGDVMAEQGNIVFPKDSSEETRLISTNFIQDDKSLDELFSASISMKLTVLPKGEQFSFAFGLLNMESYQGEPGNVEVAFSNQNGAVVEVKAYDENGKPKTIVGPVKCGAIGQNITYKVLVAKDGQLTFWVSGKQICKNKKLPITGKGHVGFVQTGGCSATVSDINLVMNKYDAPQNSNIVEDFETGAMNTGVFSSKTLWKSNYYPQSLSVQEYEGNKVLFFERCGLAYIGTKHQYSNFELSFDVPFLQRQDIRNEQGEIIDPCATVLLVSFGGDTVDASDYGYVNAAESIVFHNSSEITNYRGEHVTIDPKHLLFDKEEQRGFSVRISVIDAAVTVGVKWENEENYSTVLSYTLKGGTPTGHIHIWSPDVGNYAIDNLKITNKDTNPNLIDVEYAADTFDAIADYAYEKSPLVFREDTEKVNVKENTTVNKPDYTIVLYAGVVGILAIIIGVIIRSISRKKREVGGQEHE